MSCFPVLNVMKILISTHEQYNIKIFELNELFSCVKCDENIDQHA